MTLSSQEPGDVRTVGTDKTGGTLLAQSKLKKLAICVFNCACRDQNKEWLQIGLYGFTL